MSFSSRGIAYLGLFNSQHSGAAQVAQMDSCALKQRLGSLLIDLQAGGEQVRSVWDVWHNSEDAEHDSFVMLDKPQTAPPPASPSENTFESQARPEDLEKAQGEAIQFAEEQTLFTSLAKIQVDQTEQASM